MAIKKYLTDMASMSTFSRVDMFDVDIDDYQEVIKACRFYYKKDPLVASVINRLADMAATDIVIEKGNLRTNEYKALLAIIPMLKNYVRDAVREALISGLVYTEVDFRLFKKEELRVLGVKNYNTLKLPEKIWFRNPETIVIKPGLTASDARYFLKIPQEFIAFIKSGGKYSDGTVDKELYNRIVQEYKDLVKAIKDGKTEFPLSPRYKVLRKEIHPNSPYPVPYLTPIIEHAAYKRNLRRMDYATASRVITAIMLVRLGNDKYPLTEDDEDAFVQIEQQLRAQQSMSSSSISFERIIQLFADHTLQIDWVFPPVDVLLDDKKYDPINQEILVGLGFPMSALIGESLRSNAKNDTAISNIPGIVINPIRELLLSDIKQIVYDIINMNRFRGEPDVIRFEPIRLESVETFIKLLDFLYSNGNLSGQTMLEKVGFDWNREIRRRVEEYQKLEKTQIPVFPPTPHSNEPPVLDNTQTVEEEE